MVPDLNTIKAIQKIAWSSGSGSLHLVHASNDDIHKAHEKVGTIKAIQRIAWSSGSDSLHLVHASNDDIHKAHEKVGTAC